MLAGVAALSAIFRRHGLYRGKHRRRRGKHAVSGRLKSAG